MRQLALAIVEDALDAVALIAAMRLENINRVFNRLSIVEHSQSHFVALSIVLCFLNHAVNALGQRCGLCYQLVHFACSV